MYYSAEAAQKPGTHCVGAATASSPQGPFIARPESFACHIDAGGALDPSGFIDDNGKMYVVYKVDGNNIGHGGLCNNGNAPIVPTPIMLQEVSPADGPLVEAPALVKVNGMYTLFFSSGCYTGAYDTSYATSVNGITNGGQHYVKSREPLLITGTYGLQSPGGLSINRKNPSEVIFHADDGANNWGMRQMYTGHVTYDANARKVTI